MNCNETPLYGRGMAIVAHADDAEWGFSGTVAKWCREGMDFVYVICTDGSKGSSDETMTSRQLAKIRRLEQQAAASVLGVTTVVFLEYEDSMLEPTLDLRRDLVREIRRHKPDVIICQSPVRNLHNRQYVGHPDHLAAGEATLSSVFPSARDRLTFPELADEGLGPHKVRELLISDSEGADKWVDVSGVIDVAVEALEKHKSQIGDNDVGKSLRESRSRTGKKKNMTYAEAFRSFKFRI